MQYLVSRNEEYLIHIEKFNEQMADILEKLQYLEYNILELQKKLNDFSPESDAQKKEKWFAKQK